MFIPAVVFALACAAYAIEQRPLRVPIASYPDLYEASILQLQEGLQKQTFTSVDLVKVDSISTLPLIL